MTKTRNDDATEPVLCPVSRFFLSLEKLSGQESGFMQHLSRSRVELLKAVKCLIDEKIEKIEKGEVPQGKKKATRIKVE